MKNVYLLVILIVTLLSNCTHKKEPQDTSGSYLKAYFIMGIDDKTGQSVVRGRNDMNLLAMVYSNHVNIIGFPRETLVKIPERGHYMINGMYPFLTSLGAVRNMEDVMGIKIDKFYAIDIPRLRNLIKSVPRIKKNFKKDEQWIRHRKTLKMEIARQLRIQTYLKKLYKVMKYVPLTDTVYKTVLKESIYSDIASTSALKSIYKDIKSKDIYWYIYPGSYQRVRFNYKWYSAKEKWVYILDKQPIDNFNTLPETVNPFTFSKTNIMTTSTNMSKKIYAIDWYQTNFYEYGTNGIMDITANYFKHTNRNKRISYLLRTVK